MTVVHLEHVNSEVMKERSLHTHIEPHRTFRTITDVHLGFPG